MIFGRRAFRKPCKVVNGSATFLQVAGPPAQRSLARADAGRAGDDRGSSRGAYSGENANPTMRMASLSDATVGDMRTALVLLPCAVRLIPSDGGRDRDRGDA